VWGHVLVYSPLLTLRKVHVKGTKVRSILERWMKLAQNVAQWRFCSPEPSGSGTIVKNNSNVPSPCRGSQTPVVPCSHNGWTFPFSPDNLKLIVWHLHSPDHCDIQIQLTILTGGIVLWQKSSTKCKPQAYGVPCLQAAQNVTVIIMNSAA